MIEIHIKKSKHGGWISLLIFHALTQAEMVLQVHI